MMPSRLSDGSYYFRFSSGPISHPCGCRDWLEFDGEAGEWVQKHSSCQRHDKEAARQLRPACGNCATSLRSTAITRTTGRSGNHE